MLFRSCVKVNSFTITQNPVLTLVAVLSGPTSASAIVGGGVPPYTYLWNTVPNQTTSTATALNPGSTYKVKVTDTKGCSQIAFITIPLPKSNGITPKLNVSVQPNPTDGMVTINFNDFDASFNYSLEVFDGLGNVVYSKNDVKGEKTDNYTYDFSSMPKGIYFLRVTADRGEQVIKLILQ